ncbi:MAG: hypothetical protein HBSAPP02_28640 [Phycisphaerae bacterium]|nr:MAG: hypothetical protein HBSAPP02_28640 [Phycisphaerae bacterium]
MPTLNGFNANEVDPNFAFEAIPAGKYLAVITESEMKPTKSGVGQYLQITFQVIDGEYKGRLVWSRLNLDNPNATTVKIARAELSAICRAVGVLAPKDSVELHNVPLVITVGLKKRDDTGEMGNAIKGYAKKDAVAPRAPAVAGNNGTPPWKR